jgi:adenylosuccinate synthase
LDLPALRLAARLNGLTGLALTKLDVLEGRERLRVCTGYRLGERTVDELPRHRDDLLRATPIYEDFPVWQPRDRRAEGLDDLSAEARAYVDAVADKVGVPLALVSNGADRSASIVVRNPFQAG